jgi:hypothetical protein
VFPWSGRGGEWDSWKDDVKTTWCIRHERDTFTTRKEQDEYELHCSEFLPKD